MSFEIPASFLWSRLHPNASLPAVGRLKALQANVDIVFMKNGGPHGRTSVVADAWDGNYPYSLKASTTSFSVERTDGMRFEITVTDAADPTVSATVTEDQFGEVAVFGGALPDKSLIFDNGRGSLRHRVVEGGLPVQGGNLALAYTEWRAEAVAGAGPTPLDTEIGAYVVASGPFAGQVNPVHGEVEYEVSFIATVDGVEQSEKTLKPNATSRLVAWPGRPFERSVPLPSGAQKIELSFHIRAFLKADYTRYPNVTTRRYQQGERMLVRELWDTEGGVAGDLYDFAISAE